jgi:cellulose synthase/poly-beta-1,6-N-acetylglucosamine synthase-like glycosyltransferase
LECLAPRHGSAGARFVWRYLRRRNVRSRALVARLASPPLVSVVVPARNESLTIVDSVRALLALEYEAREIVIVNDGSSDDTLAVLQQRSGRYRRRWRSISR